jgi:hypothetical protein
MPGEEAQGSRVTSVVYRRRSQDWLADVDAAAAPVPAMDGDRRTADARRAALELARATLAAQHGLTAGHSDEVGLLCEEIADELEITGWDRSNLLAAAQLHDIGKVAVPDEILDKPAKLDPEEWAAVREHTPVGERIVMAVPELDDVARIVRHSHENFDGTGYPDGLSGEEIPLASRVILCVDAFHALRSDRPYRRGRSAEAAMEEIKANAGTQFDPAVVAALEGAAQRVRDGSARRFGSAHAMVRSRRVAALLIALVAAGSAFAALRGDLGFDRGDSAVADVDTTGCPLDTCSLLSFPSLRPLAARTGARPSASVAIAGGSAAPSPLGATSFESPSSHPRGDLLVAGKIERGPARRRHRHANGLPPGSGGTPPAAAVPQPPAAGQQPVAGGSPGGSTPTHPSSPPASPPHSGPKPKPKPTAPKPRPKPHPRSGPPADRPSHTPGWQRNPHTPRGHAYGYYEHGPGSTNGPGHKKRD